MKKISKLFKRRVNEIKADIHDNWEAGSILMLASIGMSFLLGRFTMKVPVPVFIEKRMVAPVLATGIVRMIARHGEKRYNRKRRWRLCG